MILDTGLQPAYYYEQPTKKSKGIKPTFTAIILWHLGVLSFLFCDSSCSSEDVFSTANHDLVDLSYEFNAETIYYPTSTPLSMRVTHNGTVESKGYWRQSEEITAGTHGGTHLDAPCHFVSGKWCVSDIPLDKLMAPVVVIDISHYVKDDAFAQLTPDHLITWEQEHGSIPDGSIVLIRTGWARFWPDKLSYAGTDQAVVEQLMFPTIQPEAAQWIVDHRKIVGLGIDTMSVDKPGSEPPRTHQILEERNIYGLENVNNELSRLPPKGGLLFVMPMKLKGSSGAPCRVVAALPKSTINDCPNTPFMCRSFILSLTLVSIYIVWKQSTV